MTQQDLVKTLPAELKTLLEDSTALQQTLSVSYHEEGGYTLSTIPSQPQQVSTHSSAITPQDHKTLSQTFGPSVIPRVHSRANRALDDEFGASELNTLPRYHVKTELGVGSFGEVWEAIDHDIGRPVALKRFKGTPEEALKACAEELRFSGRLDHQGIPTIYQVSTTEDGSPYIVMRLLEGQSLQSLIQKLRDGDPETHQRFNFHRRGDLILQLLRIVSVAHQRGVLHRDIKPDNIFVSPLGEVSLLDWGIASELDEVREGPNLVCGTPIYMAPEQARGEGLSEATDLFAVGAVAYELLCLSHAAPYGSNVWELLNQIPQHKPPTLNFVYHPAQGHCPVEYTPVIMRSLNRQMAERYQSAEAFIKKLQCAQDGSFSAVCPTTLIKNRTLKALHLLDRYPRLGPITAYVFMLSAIVLIGLGIKSLI